MTVYEMEGFLRGKCLPGDMKVNESNAQYLVRKFSEIESKLSESRREFTAANATIHNLELKVEQLVAENAGLKAGVTYFAYSPEYGFDYFKDKQSAVNTAQEEIDAYREDADDGWSEDVQRVSWGVVIQQAQGFDAQNLHTSDSQHTYQTCDYKLVDAVETPATDAFLAEVRAQGVEMFSRKFGGGTPLSNLVKEVAADFAAQLRQGADHE